MTTTSLTVQLPGGQAMGGKKATPNKVSGGDAALASTANLAA
eukprot:CAMPEP_0198710822 /NCGR_PEP_ID=MMETSP1471-20131121/3027_1 /TAXON_ID=41880 /ORGANISM="Pycnococcus provasolii, Strain RCC733" /LENGTH=41 /DNA_ID= /DNA_START= /DNA_END= /DNA_ORIENTATION=